MERTKTRKEFDFMSDSIITFDAKEVAIVLLEHIFKKEFNRAQFERIDKTERTKYHKTPDEIMRKFFILQALHSLTDPKTTAEQVFRFLSGKSVFDNLGNDAESFLNKRLHKESFTAKEFYYLNTVCRNHATILAQVLNLDYLSYDKKTLCRSTDDHWKHIQKTYTQISENAWRVDPDATQQMEIEFYRIVCLLVLYDNKDLVVYNFITRNRLHNQLLHYLSMLNWLFTDCPFDVIAEVK